MAFKKENTYTVKLNINSTVESTNPPGVLVQTSGVIPYEAEGTKCRMFGLPYDTYEGEWIISQVYGSGCAIDAPYDEDTSFGGTISTIGGNPFTINITGSAPKSWDVSSSLWSSQRDQWNKDSRTILKLENLIVKEDFIKEN